MVRPVLSGPCRPAGQRKSSASAWYTRYMDDFLLLHPSKEYLKHCLERSKLWRPSSSWGSMEKQRYSPQEGVDYLGFHFTLPIPAGWCVCCAPPANALQTKNEGLRKRYEEGRGQLGEINMSLASYRGHLSHGNTWRMRGRTFSLRSSAAEKLLAETALSGPAFTYSFAKIK